MKQKYGIESKREERYGMKHIGGVSASERRDYWARSPWSAFRESMRQI